MRKIINVIPEEGRKIKVIFSDGQQGIFDVSPFISGPYFSELEDINYFNQVKIFFDGIGWPNGQDIGPDTIYANLL